MSYCKEGISEDIEMAEVNIDVFTCVLRTLSKTGEFHVGTYKVVRNENGKECLLGDEIVCERVQAYPTGFIHYEEAAECAQSIVGHGPFIGGVNNTDSEDAVPEYFLFPLKMFLSQL